MSQTTINVKPSTDSTAVGVVADNISSNYWQAVKLAIGAAGEAAFVDGGVQVPASSVPVVQPQGTGTLYTAAGITSSHPEDLTTAGYKYLTLYWKTTAVGEAYIAVTAYDPEDSGDSYFLGRTAAATADDNEISLTVPLLGAQKVKVSHVVSSGALTSVTYYSLHS